MTIWTFIMNSNQSKHMKYIFENFHISHIQNQYEESAKNHRVDKDGNYNGLKNWEKGTNEMPNRGGLLKIIK
jgi:hypothetical protein